MDEGLTHAGLTRKCQHFLRGTARVSFENGIFVIGLSADHLALVDNQRNHDMLLKQIKLLGHDNVQFRFVDDPPPEDSVPEPVLEPIGDLPQVNSEVLQSDDSQPESNEVKKVKREPQPEKLDPEEFKNDSLIQKALELFKGRIVEVRK